MLQNQQPTVEDRLFSEKIGNFQTMNMMYKLKKIKKKKKQENIKNIPFPEVLSNIYQAEPSKESDLNSKKTVVEGFERMKYSDEDWDGHDLISDKADKSSIKDPRQMLVNFINYVYNSTVVYNHMAAALIVNKISNNKIAKGVDEIKKGVTNDLSLNSVTDLSMNGLALPESGFKPLTDEDFVYHYLCVIEAIIFSSLVVNNWYYVMFYNNFNNDDKYSVKRKLLQFSVEYIKSLPDSTKTNQILKNGVLYFFEYALFFPMVLEWLLVNYIPQKVLRVFSHTFCYMLLFFLIAYCSYNLAAYFKNFLIDCINGNAKNFMVGIMAITVVVLFLLPEGGGQGGYGITGYFNNRSIKKRTASYRKEIKDYLDTHQPTYESWLNEILDIEGSIEKNEDNEVLIKKRDQIKAINKKIEDLRQASNKIKDKLMAKYGIRSQSQSSTPSIVEPSQVISTPENSFSQKGGSGTQPDGLDALKNALIEPVIDNQEGGEEEGRNANNDTYVPPTLQGTQGNTDPTIVPAAEVVDPDSTNQPQVSRSREAATTVFKIIWNICRFLVIVMISVPFAGLFCIIYFVIYSLFGIVICMGEDLNIEVVSSEFEGMLKFIDYRKPLPEDPTFFQNVLMVFNVMLEFVSDHFFILVYLLVFIYLLTDSFYNIKNITLKNVSIGVDAGFILLTLFYLMYVLKTKFKSIQEFGSSFLRGRAGEKVYDASVKSFLLANAVVLGITVYSFCYTLYLFIKFNLDKNPNVDISKYTSYK